MKHIKRYLLAIICMAVFIALNYCFSIAGELSFGAVIVTFLISWVVFPIISMVGYYAVRDFIKSLHEDDDVLRW